MTAEFSPVGWIPGPFSYTRRDAFGAERMQRSYNFKGVLDAGGVAVMGTDWPVSSLDPWMGFEGLVTRRNAREPDAPAFAGTPLSLAEASRVMTINGAHCMGTERDTGSIEVGKSADLMVLDRNLFEVEPFGGISGSQVLLTLLEGRPTWDGGGLLAPHGLQPVWADPPPAL